MERPGTFTGPGPPADRDDPMFRGQLQLEASGAPPGSAPAPPGSRPAPLVFARPPVNEPLALAHRIVRNHVVGPRSRVVLWLTLRSWPTALRVIVTVPLERTFRSWAPRFEPVMGDHGRAPDRSRRPSRSWRRSPAPRACAIRRERIPPDGRCRCGTTSVAPGLDVSRPWPTCVPSSVQVAPIRDRHPCRR